MKPFRIPRWRQRQIRSQFLRKDRVISAAVVAMESVMRKAVDDIYAHGLRTGTFYEPALNAMFGVTEHFYRSVVTEAVQSCQQEKRDQKGKKRLAKLPMGMPKKLKTAQDLFYDQRYWPRVMKRSKALTERLKKSYLKKLSKIFDELLPRIREGKISPEETKTSMMEAWDASKSRVETIFRTETTNYFGRTQVAYFDKDPEIIGFLFDSIRDRARTPICKSRHGLVYRPDTKELRENTPALHYNCRSHLIALANTPYNREMLEDPSRDPAKVSVVPLPSGWRN